MFSAILSLEDVKRLLVTNMFSSEEDGDPDKYLIDFYVDEETNDLMIVLQEDV